jgi:hypothetical protein
MSLETVFQLWFWVSMIAFGVLLVRDVINDDDGSNGK